MRKCFLVEFDNLEYLKSLDLQKRIREIKEEDREFQDFLFVLQHNPVFTIGRKGSREDIIVSDEILKKENIDVVFGSNNKVKIGISTRYACPSKNSKERQKLEQLLMEHGKWYEVAQLDTNAINKIIKENLWDKKIIDVFKQYVSLEESKRLYLSKIKNE